MHLRTRPTFSVVTSCASSSSRMCFFIPVSDIRITHFDLANNYGPPYGSAEETFGQILGKDLPGHRDEIVVSTKAGWDMWPGPYGDGAAPPRMPSRSCPASAADEGSPRSCGLIGPYCALVVAFYVGGSR
jgi:hypothetical protein